ncbi:MAG: hypothetical protein ACK58M_25680 [Acidobacteriota bacterium]|jgi:hypothetical protein|nr:hypothetical protein [Bryobacteraceae bacterium CoA2 C42]
MNVRLLLDGNIIIISNQPPRRGALDLTRERLDAVALRSLRQMLAAEVGAAALRYPDRKVLEEADKRLAAKRWTHYTAEAMPLLGHRGGAEVAAPPAAPPAARDRSTAKGEGGARHPAEAKSGGSTSPAAKEPELTWIEIQIVDEDGQPLSGETYQFTKTDGAMAQGTTSGTALRADQIPAGKCKLKLPDLHKNGWTGHGKTR